MKSEAGFRVTAIIRDISERILADGFSGHDTARRAKAILFLPREAIGIRG